jgi:hypothetical protein
MHVFDPRKIIKVAIFTGHKESSRKYCGRRWGLVTVAVHIPCLVWMVGPCFEFEDTKIERGQEIAHRASNPFGKWGNWYANPGTLIKRISPVNA